MVGAENGKKQKLDEENNGGGAVIDNIDQELIHSIEKLQEVQDELEKINEEASEKVLEVEQKYNGIRKPVYDKRNELIKSIPEFWLSAFTSHPTLNELLTEEDQKIFKYLSNLEVEDYADVKSGYSITFYFSPNPYFEDAKLTKSYKFLEEEGATEISATPIKWKEGMGPANGIASEKNGNKRSHSEDSFFLWFNDAQQTGDMDVIQDEIAEIIKDDLWPNPLTYFNNELDEEEHDMEDDDEEKGSDGSDDEEDDEEEEEDEE